MKVFQSLFQCGQHQLLPKVQQYLGGLIHSPKGQANCTKMAQGFPELGSQNLHHLVSDSPWEYQALFHSLTQQVGEAMKQQQDETALLIDEVGFRKKGKHSACVGRQWLGCLGKQDNGQVAVAAVLSSGNLFCPVEAELFMPKDWEPDLDRREKTGIPEDIEHRSKPQMALEMIRRIGQNAHFDYVNFDALYGCSYHLLSQLKREGISFVGDVRRDTHVYLEPPAQKKPSGRGRPPKNPGWDGKHIPVEKYLEGIDNQFFDRAVIRNGVNGKVSAEYHVVPVWIVAENEPMELRLIIRRDMDGKVKYSLTNILKSSVLEHGRRQGQRIFVEQAFREGKNQLGMGDYQVRSWTGFHRHMALVFMGLYLVLKAKAMEGIPPTLTAADVVEVMRLMNSAIYRPDYQRNQLRALADKCLIYYELYCKAHQFST